MDYRCNFADVGRNIGLLKRQNVKETNYRILDEYFRKLLSLTLVAMNEINTYSIFGHEMIIFRQLEDIGQ